MSFPQHPTIITADVAAVGGSFAALFELLSDPKFAAFLSSVWLLARLVWWLIGKARVFLAKRRARMRFMRRTD